MTGTPRPVVLVSACLLGDRVRYDGGHRPVPGLGKELSTCADIRPVCPEVGCGMTVPREPIQLTETPDGIRLLSLDGERDYTRQMTDWISEELDVLAGLHLAGAVLKARSPSCAIHSSELRDLDDGLVRRDISGMFVQALLERFPDLQVMDEDGIGDPELLRSFLGTLHSRGGSCQTS